MDNQVYISLDFTKGIAVDLTKEMEVFVGKVVELHNHEYVVVFLESGMSVGLELYKEEYNIACDCHKLRKKVTFKGRCIDSEGFMFGIKDFKAVGDGGEL